MSATGVGDPSGESLRDQVYVSIRADLLSGKIAPSQRLGEERLAHTYGVSRTPVREALARLQSDGLVQRADHGLYPYRPRVDELGGLYELRILLELQGLRRILEDDTLRHDTDILERELDRWYALRARTFEPHSDFVTLDEGFHIAVLASAGNPALVDALVTVNAKIRPVRMFDHLTSGRLETSVEEHILIAELILDDQLTAACDKLRAHIDESKVLVVERAHQALAMAGLASAVRN